MTRARRSFVALGLLAVAVAVSILAVHRVALAPGHVAPASSLRGAVCELPLARACDDAPCPSYDQLVATVRTYADRHSEWTRAEIGTCGSGSYVLRGAWYMTETYYFDGSHTFVGSARSVDNLAQFCDGKTGQAHYGTVPVCTRTPTDVILDGGNE